METEIEKDVKKESEKEKRKARLVQKVLDGEIEEKLEKKQENKAEKTSHIYPPKMTSEFLYFLLRMIESDEEFYITGEVVWKRFLRVTGRDQTEWSNLKKRFLKYIQPRLYRAPMDRVRILTLYQDIPIFEDQKND